MQVCSLDETAENPPTRMGSHRSTSFHWVVTYIMRLYGIMDHQKLREANKARKISWKTKPSLER